PPLRKSRLRRPRAGRSPPTQDTEWNACTLDAACPACGERQGSCGHSSVRGATNGGDGLREAAVVRQPAGKGRRARWCDRERCATWLDDDAEGVRVGKEGLRIVGPDQAVGHDVVEGIVAHASIGVAGRIGDVAAKTEWRLILRGLRRVRE